jgi:hypothetical protein
MFIRLLHGHTRQSVYPLCHPYAGCNRMQSWGPREAAYEMVCYLGSVLCRSLYCFLSCTVQLEGQLLVQGSHCGPSAPRLQIRQDVQQGRHKLLVSGPVFRRSCPKSIEGERVISRQRCCMTAEPSVHNRSTSRAGQLQPLQLQKIQSL